MIHHHTVTTLDGHQHEEPVSRRLWDDAPVEGFTPACAGGRALAPAPSATAINTASLTYHPRWIRGKSRRQDRGRLLASDQSGQAG